jgi:hypothetical protein
MAKGTESKNQIFAKLKQVYPDAFWEDEGKILRIPMSEGSGVVEIKVTLTAAKSNMGSGELRSAFGAAVPSAFGTPIEKTVNPAEVTEEEKQNVADLIAALNL